VGLGITVYSPVISCILLCTPDINIPLISGEKANILIGKVWDSWFVIVLYFVYWTVSNFVIVLFTYDWYHFFFFKVTGIFFNSQGLWNVERDKDESNERCILRVYVNVAFSKKTIFRGMIFYNTFWKTVIRLVFIVNNILFVII